MDDETASPEAAKPKKPLVGDRQPAVPGAHDDLLNLLRTPGLEHREHRHPNRMKPSEKKKR